MKILIDGQTLATPEMGRGIGVYFQSTTENILANDLTNDFFITANDPDLLRYFSPWARDRMVFLENEFSADAGLTADQAQRYSDFINSTIEREGIDLYWSPNPLMNNILLPQQQSGRARFAATVFDLIPLVMKSDYEPQWCPETFKHYEAKLGVLASHYDLYLHISDCTRRDFQRIVQNNQKRHVVTPLAAAQRFRPYPFPEFVETRSYILYPGGFDPRKNVDRALDAFARLLKRFASDALVQSTDLVIACDFDPSSRATVDSRARSLGIADRFRLTGFLSGEDLVTLYQNARCLFFPSLYEGFGLPVLEGLACGLPIAASNVASIPEVAGDAALYFDPYDIEDMTSTLYRALHARRDLKSRLRRQNHAQRFSWTRTALATIEAWTRAVEEN